MDNTNTQFDQWEKLPKKVRDLLLEESTLTTIDTIAEKHGLGDVEKGFLAHICANLMKGIIHPVDFVGTIESELSVERGVAALIAQEVNKELFSKIKEELKEIHTRKTTMVIDPKLVTCLPDEQKKGEIPSGNVATTQTVEATAPQSPNKSILEQKLEGSFRVKSEIAHATGVEQKEQPTTPAVTPPQSVPTKRVDPYRELPK